MLQKHKKKHLHQRPPIQKLRQPFQRRFKIGKPSYPNSYAIRSEQCKLPPYIERSCLRRSWFSFVFMSCVLRKDLEAVWHSFNLTDPLGTIANTQGTSTAFIARYYRVSKPLHNAPVTALSCNGFSWLLSAIPIQEASYTCKKLK